MKKQEEQREIGFEEMVRVRRDEMASVLPGFYTQIVDGDKVAIIESPSAEERSRR